MHAKRSARTGRRAGPATTSNERRRRPGPPGAMLVGDSGATAAGLLDLQRLSGNRAVAQLVRSYAGNGKVGSITLHGQATPLYDGGTSTVLRPQVKRTPGCDCPADEPCLTGTGTLQVTYRVDVDVVMPEVPTGLTACQERRVRVFLRDVLGPHEQDHARRLRSYDGTTRRPFKVEACGRQALDDAVQSRIQQMHTEEHDQRSADADRKSAAIDPFDKQVDLDC